VLIISVAAATVVVTTAAFVVATVTEVVTTAIVTGILKYFLPFPVLQSGVNLNLQMW
jgi:hypothetical protein